MQKQCADFFALTRPRVVLMVMITTLVGFYLASVGTPDYLRLIQTLLGLGFAAGGTLALNQYLERDLDARMERTRLRPLPDGRLRPRQALIFGIAITGGGLLHLAIFVNPLSALVTAISVGSYLFVYTPLKRKTSLCSIVGAVPGALPPVIGWGAARGELGLEAWVLFGILFFWQIPHSLAIARLYREDYARAGIRVLPVVIVAVFLFRGVMNFLQTYLMEWIGQRIIADVRTRLNDHLQTLSLTFYNRTPTATLLSPRATWRPRVSGG